MEYRVVSWIASSVRISTLWFDGCGNSCRTSIQYFFKCRAGAGIVSTAADRIVHRCSPPLHQRKCWITVDRVIRHSQKLLVIQAGIGLYRCGGSVGVTPTSQLSCDNPCCSAGLASALKGPDLLKYLIYKNRSEKFKASMEKSQKDYGNCFLPMNWRFYTTSEWILQSSNFCLMVSIILSLLRPTLASILGTLPWSRKRSGKPRLRIGIW